MLVICFLLSGCKTSFTSNYVERNRFIFYNGEINRFFYNDSLKVSMNLNDDYTAGNSNNVIGRKQYKFYKKIIETIYPNLKVNKENFVYRANTEIDPWIQTALFEFPGNSGDPSLIVDTARLSTLHLTQCNDKQFVNIFTLDKKEDKAHFPLLIDESKQLSQTIKCDGNYVKASPMFPFDALDKSFVDSANYLSPIFLANDIESQYYGPNKFLWLQAALTYNSFMLNNKEFYNLQSTFYKPKDKVINSSILDNGTLAFIKNEIPKHQIVMMNEQHWQPKHRYLGNLLLKNFYDAGFRYLAVEAVFENSDSLNNRKYPLQKTGYYTKEPQFGNFIRNALNMGFKIIPYDYLISPSQDREQAQAENIYNNILKTNPNAKIFIWAGVEHISKIKSQKPKMGYYLKEITGIEPYTIEETAGDLHSHFLGKHYLAINSDSDRNYFQSNLCIYNNIKESDFQIIPGAVEKKINITLSDSVKSKIKQQGKVLLMVYIKDEFDNYRFNAVPVINYLIDNNKQPSVKLPKGNYTAIIRTRYSSIIDQFIITVK